MSQPPSRSRRDDVRLDAWRAILELRHDLTSVLDDELQTEVGMDLSTYDALLHVFEAGPDGIRMTDMSHRLLLSKSGLTTLVDRLEQRALLSRLPDPSDRRAIRVALTDDGEAAFRAAAKVHMAGIARHFSARVSEEEARTIVAVAERVRDRG